MKKLRKTINSSQKVKGANDRKIRDLPNTNTMMSEKHTGEEEQAKKPREKTERIKRTNDKDNENITRLNNTIEAMEKKEISDEEELQGLLVATSAMKKQQREATNDWPYEVEVMNAKAAQNGHLVPCFVSVSLFHVS